MAKLSTYADILSGDLAGGDKLAILDVSKVAGTPAEANVMVTLTEFAAYLGAGSGDALVANPLSQFAATTSAQLKGVISDETGSGALVFAASPTFTGTATFGTVAATTITGAGSGITALNGAAIASGQIPMARMATGTADGTKFIRDDGTLQAIPGGGDALVANPLSQFAATTSLQLKNTISDETGSGALVFATSPVFTTPNIGTATGSVSGNAGTATKLVTARTINGVSFDGTANISITAAAGGNIAINDQTGTSYTLVIGDLGKLVRCANAAANTMTVPPNASVAFAIGDTITVEQTGAGVTTLVAGAGVTLNTPPLTSLALAGQRSMVTLVKVATNEWDVSGALVSTQPKAQTVAIATADVPIDYSLGRVVKTTLGANISTFTITKSPATGTFGSILWKGVADGTLRTVAFSVNGATAKWDGGAAPTIPTTSGHEIWVQLTTSDAWATAQALLIAAALR